MGIPSSDNSPHRGKAPRLPSNNMNDTPSPLTREEYNSTIVSAVDKAKGTDPFTPVIVLCAATALDDVTAAVASSPTPYANVEVTSLDNLLHTAARQLGRKPLQRRDVANEVADLLRDDAPQSTVFHDKRLNNSAATLEGMTDAVFELANVPPAWRELHKGITLPQASAQMTDSVLARLKASVYTYPEAVDAAVAYVSERSLIVVGNLRTDARAEWALDRLTQNSVHVTFDGSTPFVERASLVAETDEAKFVAHGVAKAVDQGANLHELAVAYCNESQLPYLTQAFDDAGISYSAPSTEVWSQEPYFRALVTLLRLDPSEMNRRDLTMLLSTGALERKKTDVEVPSLFAFDAVSRNSAQQFYSGEDWNTPFRDEQVEQRATPVVRWVNHLSGVLTQMWTATSWPEFADRFADAAGKTLRPARLTEVIYRDELLRTLRRQHGAVSRLRAFEAVAPLFEQPQPTHHTGLVRIGPLESLAGRCLHTAFIVGALDDALPGSITPSATTTFEQTNSDAMQFISRRRQAFTAALTSAQRVIITHPRSHQDGSGSTQPSQWASTAGLASLGLTATPYNDFAHIDGAQTEEPVKTKAGVSVLPQWSSMLMQGMVSPLTSVEESMIQTAQGTVHDRIARYRDIMHFREEGAHGNAPGAEFNGYTGMDFTNEVFGADISNSRLEAFARSPLFFFLERILDSHVLEDKVSTMRVEATEGGTLYHSILEAWTRDVLIPAGEDVAEASWWEQVARPALEAIVDDALAKMRSERVNAAVWQGFSTTVRRDIEAWFQQERTEILGEGWRPIGAEVPFGVNHGENTARTSPTIDVPTAAGTTASISFNGIIDRVDYKIAESTDSSDSYVTLRITDYKTGSKWKTLGSVIDAKQPTGSEQDGYYFQLALYGSALYEHFVRGAANDNAGVAARAPESAEPWSAPIAEALEGLPKVRDVQSRYWYLQAPTVEQAHISLDITEDVIEVLRDNLAHIYGHIAAGTFPPHAIKTHWTDQSMLRIGMEQYDSVTEALTEHEVIPLALRTDAEN